jgi:hypothetical protein
LILLNKEKDNTMKKPATIVIALSTGLGSILLWLAACTTTGVNNSATPKSGIEGTVTISPVGPPTADQTQPSSEPYSATLAILQAGSEREITRVTSDAEGKFRVALAPGAYRIVPVSANPMVPPYAEDLEVQVPKEGYVSVTIVYDSGIR